VPHHDPSNTTWAGPPVNLALAENTVDVWLISLTQPGDSYASLTGLLSSTERERAARFKFDVHRRRFVIAHAALRSILLQYLKTAPTDLQFVDSVNGKPRLAAELAGSGVQFNLSHSYEVALLGVTRGREIGVDIELVKEDYAFDEVAARFFTAKELAAFRALPLHLQRQAFFKCWTSKEAFLKAKGTGLSGKLDEVEITLADHQRVLIHASVPGWTLMELDPGNNYEAALVVEGGRLPINGYRWQPISSC
jgi:4'-phosphopantetheinyl transferase